MRCYINATYKPDSEAPAFVSFMGFSNDEAEAKRLGELLACDVHKWMAKRTWCVLWEVCADWPFALETLKGKLWETRQLNVAWKFTSLLYPEIEGPQPEHNTFKSLQDALDAWEVYCAL